MQIPRREWLSLMLAWPAIAAQRAEERIAVLIREYEKQGFHRTGTETDRISGEWLMAQVRRAGLSPGREPFELSRVDPVASSLTIAGRRIEGIPLFDGGFTDSAGIRGRLGLLNSDAPIGLTEAVPNSAAAGALGEARRQNRHRAIVLVTRGGRPGLCPSNADGFLHPFGPPVLQISSEERVQEGSEAVLVAQVTRTPSQAFNVTARIAGNDKALPPLVIMTPRSGWWSCASERGGGLACWLELMRSMRAMKPARDVWFVASSGHEVGYLGIEAYAARHSGIVSGAHAWIHLGANIGAAQSPANTLQASDDQMERMLAEALKAPDIKIDRRIPRGTIPGGEAGVVHRGGGHYMSVIGGNALFHNSADRGPDVVDLTAIARFSVAFTSIAKTLAA
jgi:hypothetical protein